MVSAARLATLIARHARAVTLRFATGGGSFTDVPVLAHVMDYRPSPLAGSVATPQQGEREVRIAQAALDAASAPRAPRQGDRIVLDDGKSLAIGSVEPRALRGDTAMIVIRAHGA